MEEAGPEWTRCGDGRGPAGRGAHQGRGGRALARGSRRARAHPLQRRRQQRRTAVCRATTLSVTGVALLLALGFGGRAPRDELAARGISRRRRRRRRRSSPSAPSPARPGAPAAPSASASIAPVGVEATRVSSAPAPSKGHLLQQRLVPRRQVAAARWVALAGRSASARPTVCCARCRCGDLSDPDDLMLAADVARQAGRPERAVPFLERVVKEHPHEVCAQLAGFSLGKVYPRQPRRAGARGAHLRGRARHGARRRPGAGRARARGRGVGARRPREAQARDVATGTFASIPDGSPPGGRAGSRRHLML